MNMNLKQRDSAPRWAAALVMGGMMIVGVATSGTAAGPAAPPQEYPVGYRVIRVDTVGPNGERTQINAAVWYPTTDRPRPLNYIYGENSVRTDVAPNGQVAPGQFPLVVYSHGATGCGLSSAFLTERLASQGFIVAAPDHTDEYVAARIDPATLPRQSRLYKFRMLRFIGDVKDRQLNTQAMEFRTRLAYRPKQVVATIDTVLAAGSPFQASIDQNSIGLAGHSFGAWTSMLVAGIDPRYKDSRVKALLALSGPVNPNIYTASELAGLNVPVMLMYGTVEVAQGRGDDRGLFYDRMHPPKFLLGVQGADHFSFSGGVRFEFPSIQEYYSRDASRNEMVRYSEAFLEYYLKQDPNAKTLLTTPANNYVFDLGTR